jgi:hypothetical protein
MLETCMIEGVAWQFCYVDLLLRQKFILAPHDILGLTAELMILLLRMHEDLEMVLCMDPLEIPDFDLHVANLGAMWNHSGLRFREFIELVFVLCAEKKTQVLTNVPKHWATVVEALQLKRCPICQADIIAPDFSFIEHFSSLHWNTDASRTHLRLVASVQRFPSNDSRTGVTLLPPRKTWRRIRGHQTRRRALCLQIRNCNLGLRTKSPSSRKGSSKQTSARSSVERLGK